VTNEDGATTGGTWSIKFATVTINTLTINGKQVTLDVFRQLKEAVLINHDGSLAGSPWGLVHYHQKRCDRLEKHAHVVWQLDDQLRQDTIQPPRWEPYRSDTCDALVFAAGTLERLPNITWPSGPPPEAPERPRQSRPSWPRLAARGIWTLRGYTIPLQPPPEEPEQPSRFRWNRPEVGRMGRREGVGCLTASNAAPTCLSAWAARSWRPSTPLPTGPRCSRSSRMRLPPRRRAAPSMK
jgi:hypothetical protein